MQLRDSAIEAAVSLADAGNRVSLSYRKSTLSRPKEHNLAAYEARVSNGSIRSLLGSQVLEVRDIIFRKIFFSNQVWNLLCM